MDREALDPLRRHRLFGEAVLRASSCVGSRVCSPSVPPTAGCLGDLSDRWLRTPTRGMLNPAGHSHGLGLTVGEGLPVPSVRRQILVSSRIDRRLIANRHRADGGRAR